jgi:hypothetical protein
VGDQRDAPAALPPRNETRYPLHMCGQGSSVGIETGYGLDGPGIKSRLGVRFFAHVQTGPGPHPASCTMGSGPLPDDKGAGAWCSPPTPSSAQVTKGSSYTFIHPLGQVRPVTGLLYLFYPLYRMLGVPQARSGRVRKMSPPPGFNPRTLRLVASCYPD